MSRFHRRHGPTQTNQTADEMVASAELWGGPDTYSGDEAVARAYSGPLPEGYFGIEFECVSDAKPDSVGLDPAPV